MEKIWQTSKTFSKKSKFVIDKSRTMEIKFNHWFKTNKRLIEDVHYYFRYNIYVHLQILFKLQSSVGFLIAILTQNIEDSPKNLFTDNIVEFMIFGMIKNYKEVHWFWN